MNNENKLSILHVSDIHISKKSIEDVKWITEKLITDIDVVCKENNLKVDIVCFVGDLIEKGEKAFDDELQVQLAEDCFITPLLSSLDLGREAFFFVPGNHEVNVADIDPITERGLATVSSEADIDTLIDTLNATHLKRLDCFYKYMYGNMSGVHKENLGYAIKEKINGVSFGLVGIDSAWRSSGAGESERGKMIVGKRQVRRLFDIIEDTDFKICLMHHPTDWLMPSDIYGVEAELNKFDLVLRGHVHGLSDKQICTQDYKTVINTSGKLYPIENGYVGYSLIQVDMNDKTCKVFSREYYSEPRACFDKALRVNENGVKKYDMKMYSDEKLIELDLKKNLKVFFEDSVEKYTMLRSIDTDIPNRIGDVFVCPSLYAHSKYERSEKARKNEELENALDFNELLIGDNNILFFGSRESGKTTILYRFGIENTDVSSKYIPVYIDISNLSKGKDRIQTTCKNFIFNNLSTDTKISGEQVEKILEKGKLICLFDNVRLSSPNHTERIREFIKLYPNNRYIMTAEESFYQTYGLKDMPDLNVEFSTAYIDFFRKRQVRELVTKWGAGRSDFDANEMTKKIVTYCNNIGFSLTPYTIAIFMTIWDVDKNFVPINEGKVMRTYLETILDRLSVEGFSRGGYDFDVKQHFLAFLAYKMYEKDEYCLSLADFERIVNDYHEIQGYKKSETRFDKVFFEKNILYCDSDTIYFCNTSILEYCLAYYAVLSDDLYQYMIRAENRCNFIHELSFYAGIICDCTDMLNILYEEVMSVIDENMNIINEVEEIEYSKNLLICKEEFVEQMKEKRPSIGEIDDMTDRSKKYEKDPKSLTKLGSVEKDESFFRLLEIYGNTIKNAETLDKKSKSLHLETYMYGISFLYGLFINELSEKLKSTSKDDFSEETLAKYPNLTEEEFAEMKNDAIELVKVFLPIGLQLCVSANVGTPKLGLIINELINTNKDKPFLRYMLSFLYCDMQSVDVISFLKAYIKEEKSKDILTLIILKLETYYNIRYFGEDKKIDEALIEMITDISIRFDNKNTLRKKHDRKKGENNLRRSMEAKRKKSDY